MHPLASRFALLAVGLTALSPSIAAAQQQPAVSPESSAPCVDEPRLRDAARYALEHAEHLTTEALRATAEQSGFAAPSIRVWVGRGAERAADAEITRWIAAQSLDRRVCRVARVSDGALHAVVLAPRSAEFTVNLQTNEASSTVTFAARFAVPLRNPHVVLTSPEGRSFVAPLDRAQVLPTRGAWSAQLVGESEQGPIAWARRTITVGASAEVAERAGVGPIRDERGWLTALNRARATLGAQALRNDPLLLAVARTRARACAAQSTVAHAVVEGDTPDAHLSREGIRSAQVAENVARAATLDEAFARLDRSPAHRRVRMDGSFDAAAIAAVQAEDGWYVIELFALRPALSQ